MFVCLFLVQRCSLEKGLHLESPNVNVQTVFYNGSQLKTLRTFIGQLPPKCMWFYLNLSPTFAISTTQYNIHKNSSLLTSDCRSTEEWKKFVNFLLEIILFLLYSLFKSVYLTCLATLSALLYVHIYIYIYYIYIYIYIYIYMHIHMHIFIYRYIYV